MAKQYGAADPVGKPTSNAYGAERKDNAPEAKDKDTSPSAEVVAQLHKNASVDRRPEDIHHMLGLGPNSASRGSHSHDGTDSMLLLEGFSITGSKASPSTVFPSIINALVRLGAKDATT